MKRRTCLAGALVALGTVGLSGCSTPPVGDALIQLNHQAADALLQGVSLDPRQPVLLLGGAFIDAQGREIPITESMIQRACRDLEHHCQPLRKRS